MHSIFFNSIFTENFLNESGETKNTSFIQDGISEGYTNGVGNLSYIFLSYNNEQELLQQIHRS